MARFIYSVAGAVTLVCGLAQAAHAERLKDPNLKFSLTIPDDFAPDPQLAAAQPGFVHAFRKTEPQDVGVVIIIERLRGTLGRERLDPSKAPPGFAGTMLTLQWQGLDIDALEVPEEVGGIATVNYNVQVPLAPEAIQIRVVGRRDRKDQLLQLTKDLLASLEGKSNWLKSSAPTALANSPSYGAVILAACGVGIVAGLAVLWLVRRVSPRGTVLVLAVLIFAASWVLPPGDTREMRAAVGTMRLLGFLGFALGLVDLYSHPTGKRSGQAPPSTVDPGPGRSG